MTELDFPRLPEEMIALLHGDYLRIREMGSEEHAKRRMLDAMFSQNPHCWRVIGITSQALTSYADNDFEKPIAVRINRSHLHQRARTMSKMLAAPMGREEWWTFYVKHDVTILTTSSENAAMKAGSDVSYLAFEPGTSLTHFLSSGYQATYARQEKLLLRAIHQRHSRRDIPLTNFKIGPA